MDYIAIFLSLTIFSISLISATDFGYNNLDKPTLSKTVINYTNVNVNNSIYWDGHAWSETGKFLVNDTNVNFKSVGIGTASPTGRLEVKSLALDTYPIQWVHANGVLGGGISEKTGAGMSLILKDTSGTVTNRIYATGDSYFNGGKVGIGTMTPAAKLHINETGLAVAAQLKIESETGSAQLILDHGNTINDKTSILYTSADTLKWEVGSTRATHNFFISGDGGIGTDDFITVQQDGNVGIGTTTPTQKLNVVGDGNFTGDLDVAGNWTGNSYYAEGWGKDIGEVEIASSDVYYNITNFTMGSVNGISFNEDGGIEMIKSGLYNINGVWTFSGTANNEYHIQVAKNDVGLDNCHSESVIGTGGDIVNTGVTCFVRVGAGEHLNAQIENVDSAGNPTIHNINFNMVRIGD